MLGGENIGKIPLQVHLDRQTLVNRVNALDGKTLANQWTIAKFSNVFPRQSFTLNGITVCLLCFSELSTKANNKQYLLEKFLINIWMKSREP